MVCSSSNPNRTGVEEEKQTKRVSSSYINEVFLFVMSCVLNAKYVFLFKLCFRSGQVNGNAACVKLSLNSCATFYHYYF